MVLGYAGRRAFWRKEKRERKKKKMKTSFLCDCSPAKNKGASVEPLKHGSLDRRG